MNKGTPRIRRAVVGGLSALLAVASLVPLATGAGALANFQFQRLAGADRFETAVAIATNSFGTANTVLLARADLFPDALAGNYLAGLLNAPILLTRVEALPESTRTALGTLRTKNVVILGREEAVSAAVATELGTMTSTAAGGGPIVVSRVGGVDRYETANNIATNRTTTGGGVPGVATPTVGTVNGQRTAVVARGDSFPDALAVGPASFARHLPILLTPGAPSTTLHPQAASGLNSVQAEHVLVLGGEEAITGQVEDAIRRSRNNTPAVTTTRLQGADRTETARAIAEFALSRLGFSNAHVNLARGDLFPDALTGGPHAGREAAPILLTLSATVLSSTPDQGAARYLADHCPTLQNGHIYGGEAAVSPVVQNEATERARTCGVFGNQSFQVSPQNVAFLQAGDTRECTAFVTPGSVVDIQLFDSDNINIAPNGQVTFVSTPTAGAGTAQTGNPDAVITVTNPATTPTATNRANNVTAPASGVITFTVTSDAPNTDVTAVVFAGAGNNTLETNNGAPTEAFGIGCRTVFQADTVAPTVTDARILVDTPTAGVTGTATADDVWQFTFSEPLGETADDTGQQIRVSDVEGDAAIVTCVTPGGGVRGGGSANCELNADRTVLTITLLEEPAVIACVDPCAFFVGGFEFMEAPYEVTGFSSGVADQAGNQVNIPGSPDRIIDDE